MRCFCCNAENANVHDGPTDRDYCTSCWKIIQDLLTEERSTDTIQYTDNGFTPQLDLEEDDVEPHGSSDAPDVS